jgi:two-component system OmpR family sensor kinase
LVEAPQSPERSPAVPSRPRRWRLVPRSLTGRLVTGVVSLVFVLVCLTGTGTYIELRSFLYDRLNQQLDNSAASVAGSPCFDTPTGNFCRINDSVRTGQHLWLAVLKVTGDPVALTTTSQDLTILNLPASLRRTLIAHPGARYDFDTGSGPPLRLTAEPLTAAPLGQAPGYAVVGISTGDVRNTLKQLVAKELLIGGSAVLLALLATSYGVNFSLRRLKGVTTTAQEVAAELSPDGAGLDRRVPVTEEGTEVGALAESMNTLLAAVETQFAARLESEQRMRQFLADASHELRTPLTSIRGYAELARMQRAAGNPGEDNLGRIEAEGTRMSRLVEDLLMLARGDKDAVPRTELVDVAELLDDAVSGSRAAFPQRQIALEPVPSYHVVGDPDQLVRAIRNLVANAALHTNPERPIRVRGFEDGPGIAIQVIDGGPGLPPEEAAHVFERFWRADKARTRARGGSGLGLAIVASIAAAHAGAVHFTSTVEDGSTVTIWLPGVTPDPAGATA